LIREGKTMYVFLLIESCMHKEGEITVWEYGMWRQVKIREKLKVIRMR
jgi:hypothetical protein